jgi:hypothetical protein
MIFVKKFSLVLSFFIYNWVILSLNEYSIAYHFGMMGQIES